MSEVHIGCSGFNYPHWRGTFYPDDLPQRKWLEFYCNVFTTVELNVTFYRLPQASIFEKWHTETPDNFCFSLKGSRYITHVRKISDADEPVKRFFEHALGLQNKLKAVLWQFPPSFKKNMNRLDRFLRLLDSYPVSHALEFRNESWISDEVVDLCREHNVGLCMADAPPFINELPVTAGFVYMRRHGGGAHNADYSIGQLKKDAERIKTYARDKRDVFIYFNNDVSGFAPKNARQLSALLGKKHVRI